MNWLKSLPYWAHHVLIASGIMLACWPVFGLQAGALAGAMFYAGREVRDREKLGAWDWPGLLAPVGSMIIVIVLKWVS